jgi:lysine 6-dehydrogenase
MTYRYAVLGAGRQGTASAYDLAKFGEAEEVILADLHFRAAEAAAERVNRLMGTRVARPIRVDVTHHASVVGLMRGQHAVISAVPYFYNLDLAKAAIEAGASFCDLGGNTEIVRRELDLDADAERAGISLIPDCGMGPGMGNNLAVYAMSRLDRPRHVTIYDGGLPQTPQPPWNYQLLFSIEGLTNEYFGTTVFLRGGKLVEVPALGDPEEVEFPPPLGRLEARVTTGGVSTAPWTFYGQLETYELKTVRYPGHWAQIQAFSDLGLFDLKPVRVGDQEVVPRQVFHALFEPQISAPTVRDVGVIRVWARGEKGGDPAEVLVDVIDVYDEATGFTAMERLTGWHASIVAHMMARGDTPKGAVPLEVAVPGDAFVAEARRRGFRIAERICIG